ncbi:MAG: TetR family transcriptional regulator [Chloroflexi bacterium SZAS-1]|jgi:AcrR family transcriptional regulator|nr:TetR family transcriptional regulator [Chloroflexi bacterium SZAS-1]
MSTLRREHNAEAARAAILGAAEQIFAEQGFDGARIDAIAAASSYNKSLIFQYFGDKLKLYTAVLQRANREATELQAQIMAPLLTNTHLATDAQQLRSFFESAFRAVFEHLLARPRFLRILMWEMAEGWRTYTQVNEQLQSTHIEQLETLFATAQRAGLLRSAFSPAIQLTMALQTCQLYLASRPFYQTLLPNSDLTSADALAQAREHVVNGIVASMMFDISPNDT